MSNIAIGAACTHSPPAGPAPRQRPGGRAISRELGMTIAGSVMAAPFLWAAGEAIRAVFGW